jgi:hypothetical protein
MKRCTILIATLGLAALATSPVAAQALDPDVKCMLASDVFGRMEKDQNRRQLAVLSGLFYFGRIDGRLSPAQMKAQILAVGTQMKATDLGPVMNECAKRFQSRQQALQAIGKQVAAQAPKPPAGPAAPPKK